MEARKRKVWLHFAIPLPRLPGNCCQRLWHLAPRMLTWKGDRNPLPRLSSRRHTLQLTQIILTRFLLLTMTPDARPTITSLPCQFLPTAACTLIAWTMDTGVAPIH